MKKDKMKLAGLLLAIACASVCGAGAVVAGNMPQNGVTVSAEETNVTVHELGALKVHKHSTGSTTNTPKATAIYMAIANGTAIPYPDGNWDTEFTLESGAGWKLNGNDINGKVSDIESTNSGLYVNLANAGVQVNDVLSIEGTFYSADVNAKYVITESKFVWNGTAWEDYVEYTTYEMGKLKFHQWTANSNHLYLLRSDDQKTPTPNDGNGGWTAELKWKNGIGIALNGETLTGAVVKYPNSFFIALGVAPEVGDVVTVAGTFYNAECAVQYVVKESSFKWNGTTWENVVSEEPDEPETPSVQYTTYEIEALNAHSSTITAANTVQSDFTRTSEAFPVQSWDHAYSYEAGAITLDGEAITPSVKFPNQMFIEFASVPATGAKLKIGGTFYNEEKQTKYVVAERYYTWDGEAWHVVAEEPSVQYTTYTVKATGANGDSSATVVYLYTVTGDELPKDKGNWDDEYTFQAGSGKGVTVNGEAAQAGAIKLPGDMYVPLSVTAVAGDIFAIDGTYYNEKNAVKIVFENCQMQFDGSKWVTIAAEPDIPDVPTEAQTYELGSLVVHKHSTGATTNTPKATQLYLAIANGTAVPYPDAEWKTDFVYAEGTGVLLNGTNVTSSVGNLKSTNAGLYFSFTPGDHDIVGLDVQVGDVITVGGTFYCEKEKASYVITDSRFVWNGTAWENYVEYTTHTIEGKLIFQMTGGQNKYGYFVQANGSGLPVHKDPNNSNIHWEAEYNWKNGVGVTINDKDVGAVVKFAGQFFIAFKAAPEVGDVLKFGGTFYNEKTQVQYVIEESTFQWDGSTWVAVLEYTDYEVGSLVVAGTQNSKSNIYVAREDGEGFAIDSWDYAFTFLGGSGAGIMLNGEATGATQIKTPTNTMYVDLKTSAKEGDVLTIGGTFYNTELLVRYIITDTMFIYENGAWVVYVSPYTEIGVGEVTADPDASTAKNLYLVPEDSSVELVTDWDNYFVSTHGVGVTLNGKTLENAKIQSVDSTIYVSLGVTAQEGDTLVIGGKFVCEELALLYFVKDCAFVWDGEAWVKDIVYDTYDLGVLKVHAHSTGSTTNAPKASQLYLASEIGAFPVQSWEVADAFELVKGVGLKVNGVSKMITAMFSTDSGLFLNLAEADVQAGDLVSIEGEFVCASKGVKYVIAYSEFEWNGNVWGRVCEKFYVGAVNFDTAASASWNKTTQFGFTPADTTVQFPAFSWDFSYIRSSGVGITVNGVEIPSYNDVKFVSVGTIFIGLPTAAQKGDVLVISGSFRNEAKGLEYIIEESVFIFDGLGGWINELDNVKEEKKAALTDYFVANYAQENYDAAEWTYLSGLLASAKTTIANARVKADVIATYDEAIAAFAEVPVSGDVAANLATWKAEAKVEIMMYKDKTLYREAEQASIQTIIDTTKSAVDAATSWVAIKTAMTNAKADLDALWTAEKWDAAELAVVMAKQELMTYKAQADYRAAEWTKIQEIINKAKANIDASIGYDETIATIVANAKAEMDAVKTDAQITADEAVVAAAKAELAAYKTEADYRAKEWTKIQEIIAKAGTKIDAELGNAEAIAAIVDSAKVEMDAILKTAEAEAKEFSEAKQEALNQFQAINANIDYSKYTDEAMMEIGVYLGEAQDAINAATTAEELADIIATLQANINGVEQIKTGGCGSVVGLAAGITLVAAAAITLRKKKED